MTVLLGFNNFLPGIFTELNPIELPIVTLVMSKGVQLMPQKDYTYTYHTNPAHTNPTLTLQAELGTTNFGSTGHSGGSNCMNVWDEGFGQSFWRMGDQSLERVLGWQGPSNKSREETPMARGMLEAMDRMKFQLEKLWKDGVYNSPGNGGSGTYQQRGLRNTPGLTKKAIGVAGGSAVGSYATLTLTHILDTLQNLWENKVNRNDQLTFLSNAIPKRQITQIFKDEFNAGKNGQSRTEAGIAITSFLTDFGNIDTVLTRTMDTNTAYILNLGQFNAVGHAVDGRGFMFERDLPTAQAGVFKAIYTEMGIDVGHGSCHARLYGIGSVAGHLTTGTVEST